MKFTRHTRSLFQALKDRATGSKKPGHGTGVETTTTLPTSTQPTLPENATVVAVLRRAFWDEGGALVLCGWAYLKDAAEERERLEVSLVNLRTGTTVELPLEGASSSEPNRFSTTVARDLSHTFWRTTIDARAMAAQVEPIEVEHWQLVTRVRTPGQDVLTALTYRYTWGSAGNLLAENFSGVLIKPEWSKEAGLVLKLRTPDVVVAAVTRDATQVTLQLSVPGHFSPVSAHWSGADEQPGVLRLSLHEKVAIGSTPADDLLLRITQIQFAEPKTGNWSITLRDDQGRGRLVHWRGPSQGHREHLGSSGSQLVHGPHGVLRIARAHFEALATDVEVHKQLNEITVRGQFTSPVVPVSAGLRGPRAEVAASEFDTSDHTFSARFKLRTNGWDGRSRTAPSGGYRLHLACEDQSDILVEINPSLLRELPLQQDGSEVNLRVERDQVGRFYLDVSAPLHATEIGAYNQKLLSQRSRSAFRGEPHGVFLESWFGKNFSDNPAALFDELRRQIPSVPIRIGVADNSVAVPDGATTVIVGSQKWWEALTYSRYLINNSWFPNHFIKGRGQVLVQTWHGTPLKLLGLDRSQRLGNERAIRRIEAGANSWDLLVSQNPHSTEVFRRAYRFHGRIVESGYPRNDILRNPNRSQVRDTVRERLGIPLDQRVLLYAPTWREADKAAVGLLDPVDLAEELGPGTVVLVRGHSVALRRGTDIGASGIIDVTSYPEPAELMLAADILITDYSSIMFDFSNLEQPIFFYVPDYEEYSDEARGTYFDLRSKAPGPLVRTLTELVDRIESAGSDLNERYSRWNAEFNPHDDGYAAKRIVEAMLEIRTPQ